MMTSHGAEHGVAPRPESEAAASEPRASVRPMPMCPMAETCKGMMEKPLSGAFLVVPGVLFIAVGVLIVIEPAVLVWLLAAASILMGAMMLLLAGWMSRLGGRLWRAHGSAP